MGTARVAAPGPRSVRAVLAVVLVALLLAGCTSEQEQAEVPTPTPSSPTAQPVEATPSEPFVAVVLTAPDTGAAGTLDQAREDVARVAADAALPVRVGVGPSPAVQRDLLGLALDEGAVLACLVGRDAVLVASQVARARPGSRVCAVGRPDDPPHVADPSLLAFVPRSDELAALVATAMVAVAPPDGVVGLALERAGWASTLATAMATRAEARARAEEAALVAEVEDAEADPPTVPRVTTVAVDPELGALAAGADLRRQGRWAAVLDQSADLAGLRVGTREQVLLAGPADLLLDGGEEADVLLAWRHDVAPALALALAAAEDPAWRPGVVSTGVVDGALVLLAGGAEAGPAALQAVEAEVDALRSGAPAVLPPAPAPAEALAPSPAPVDP